MSTSRSADRRGWLVPAGALAIAAVLGVYTLATTPVGPASSPQPSRVGPTDEHAVTTAAGLVRFSVVGPDLVISRSVGATTTELARVQVTAPASTLGAAQALTGSEIFAMVCPSDAGAQRFVFGHVDPEGPVTYSGPEAVGQVASDGLFLYAIAVGAPPASVSLTEGSDRSPLVGFNATIFDKVQTSGTGQPSGCAIVG